MTEINTVDEDDYYYDEYDGSDNSDYGDYYDRDQLKQKHAVTEPITELLLKHGALVNEPASNGKTLLYYTRSDKIIRALLKYGADVNIEDKNGLTPITSSRRSHRHSSSYYRKEQIFAEHLAKLTDSGEYVNPKNLKYLQYDYESCLKKLEELKEKKFCNKISLYDIIKMEKQPKKLMLLAKCKDFLSSFHSLSWYPFGLTSFQNDLYNILGIAESNKNILLEQIKKIHESGLDKKFSLPSEIIEIIAYFACENSIFANKFYYY